MGSERRRFYRLPSRVVAVVRVPGVEGSTVYTRTASLALGGCGVRSEKAIGVGTEIEVDFEGEFGVVTLRGTIAYEESLPRGIYKIGIEFIDVTSAQRQALSHLIENDTAIG